MAIKHHGNKSGHGAASKGGKRRAGSTPVGEHGNAHHDKAQNKADVHAPHHKAHAAKKAIHTAHPKVNHSRKKGGHQAEHQKKDQHHLHNN